MPDSGQDSNAALYLALAVIVISLAVMFKCRGKFRRQPRNPESFELFSDSEDQAEQGRDIPEAIRALGAGQGDFYLSLLRDTKRLRRNKVMIVGPGRVGKTSCSSA